MPDELLIWWALLGAVSVGNVVAWAALSLAQRRHAAARGMPVDAATRVQLVLAAGYVFGCAFRASLPLIDVPRLCLVDSALSTVLVGRSVATLAELCLATQCALALAALAEHAGSAVGRAAARAILPLIVLAELCSWYAVTSRSNLGHVAEESLWALVAGLMLASLAAAWPQRRRGLRAVTTFAAFVGTGYLAFMLLVDVPMYLSRWLAEPPRELAPAALAAGLTQLAAPCTPSWRWADWREEIPWMTLYFSVAVWFSLALVRVPGLLPRRGEPPAGGDGLSRPSSAGRA